MQSTTSDMLSPGCPAEVSKVSKDTEIGVHGHFPGDPGRGVRGVLPPLGGTLDTLDTPRPLERFGYKAGGLWLRCRECQKEFRMARGAVRCRNCATKLATEAGVRL